MQTLMLPSPDGVDLAARVYRDGFQSSLWARSVALLQGFQPSPPGRPKAATHPWGVDAAGVLGGTMKQETTA